MALTIASVLAWPLLAHADGPTKEGASTKDTPVYDFDQGSQLLRDGKAKDALPFLEASMSALPSPNTELLIAHAKREIGDRPAALEAYEKTVELASARVKAGESRFAPTLDDAEHWASEMRAGLAKLSVAVGHSDGLGAIEIDGARVATHYDAANATMTAELWHEPGRVRVEAASSSHQKVSTSVVLEKGQEKKLSLELTTANTIKPPPAISWVLASVSVASFVTFGVFEGMARQKASTLEACAPHCDAANPLLDSARNQGKRDQTGAGVFVGVGAVTLVTAGFLWAVLPRSHKSGAQASIPLTKNIHLGQSGSDLSIRY